MKELTREELEKIAEAFLLVVCAHVKSLQMNSSPNNGIAGIALEFLKTKLSEDIFDKLEAIMDLDYFRQLQKELFTEVKQTLVDLRNQHEGLSKSNS